MALTTLVRHGKDELKHTVGYDAWCYVRDHQAMSAWERQRRERREGTVSSPNLLKQRAVLAYGRRFGLRTLIETGTFVGDMIHAVKRRFTRTGEVDGITVIDDYGHHPVEIAAVLKAARTRTKGQVIAVVQPHRYTRLRDLFEEFCTCFNDADWVIVCDVYAAGEEPIPGIDREHLAAGLKTRGHRGVDELVRPEALAAAIDGLARPGDLVVCLGAGNITAWANALPEELRALRRRRMGAVS
jgi:UDP-N-acetylmuramate--alanine ligase